MRETQSIVTEHEKMFFIDAAPTECYPHGVVGSGIRELAEQDGLKVPACNNCHNMGRTTERVHDNPMAEKLSKILGQAVYEAKIGSREEFRARYGKSYL